MKRGFEDKLIIDGTSYNDQGEYVCEAVNLIAGRRNKVQSGPVKMEVRGNCFFKSQSHMEIGRKYHFIVVLHLKFLILLPKL